MTEKKAKIETKSDDLKMREFQVGDLAVYPAHGVGQIQAIESRVVNGEKHNFYIMKVIESKKYIGGFDVEEDGKGGKIKVKLIGKINNCNVIKPSFAVKKDEFIKFEKRFLPAQKIGILILTTSVGVMDQNDAIKKNTGGRLLGYVY